MENIIAELKLIVNEIDYYTAQIEKSNIKRFQKPELKDLIKLKFKIKRQILEFERANNILKIITNEN